MICSFSFLNNNINFYLNFMFLTKKSLSKKFMTHLYLRSFFDTADILFFYYVLDNTSSSLDLIKSDLLRLGLVHKFFNNNKIINNLFFSFRFFNNIQGSFLVVSLRDFGLMPTLLTLRNCCLYSVSYNNFFLNNFFFNSLVDLSTFYQSNYLFVISFLTFFIRRFNALIISLKFTILFVPIYIICRLKGLKEEPLNNNNNNNCYY